MNLAVPGLFHCPLIEAYKLVPELAPVLDEAPIHRRRPYVVDVKTHMLMPKMWPCIPGWHCDFVPRVDGKPRPDLIDTTQQMFLWVSGDPLPEFRDARSVKPEKWVTFDQSDEHRGTASSIHTWRTFIRIAPTSLCVPAEPRAWIRRHTQVYLNAEDFTW